MHGGRFRLCGAGHCLVYWSLISKKTNQQVRPPSDTNSQGKRGAGGERYIGRKQRDEGCRPHAKAVALRASRLRAYLKPKVVLVGVDPKRWVTRGGVDQGQARL